MVKIATIAEKGQITIPLSMQKQYAFTAGRKMVVFSDGETIVLRPLKNSDSEEFKALCKKAQKFAADTNMTEDDIQTAIKGVRSKAKL